MAFKEFGDRIIGTLVSLKNEDGQYGLQAKALVETENGAMTVFLNSSRMRGFLECGCTLGDKIGIEYKDDGKATRGQPPKLFAVRRAGGAVEPTDKTIELFDEVWEAMAERAAEQAAQRKKKKKSKKKSGGKKARK